MSDHKSTQDLIGQIELKDRRFRLAQAVFMLATLLALIAVISAQQRTLDGVKQQLTEQKNIATAADKRSSDQQQTILRRLDCMTVFFSQTDRTNLTIKNIDKCTLDRAGDLQKFFTQDASGTPTTTKTQQPSDLPQAGSPATTPQPVQINPNSPGLTPIGPTVPPTPDPDPIRILGIPVCLPFTNVCARH